MPGKGYLASNIRKKKAESNDFRGFEKKNEAFIERNSINARNLWNSCGF
jgi:hypothetical protein